MLVIDDDASIASMVVAVLRRAGFDAEMTTSGTRAIALLECEGYAAAVVDLAMCEVTGADVVARVAARGAKTKFVVLISVGSEAALDDVPDTVIHSKLRKPFDIDEVVAAVRACVSGAVDVTEPARKNYPTRSD